MAKALYRLAAARNKSEWSRRKVVPEQSQSGGAGVASTVFIPKLLFHDGSVCIDSIIGKQYGCWSAQRKGRARHWGVIGYWTELRNR